MLNTIDHHPRLQKFLLAGIMAGSMLGIINPMANANASTERIENPAVATQMVKADDMDLSKLHITPTPLGHSSGKIEVQGQANFLNNASDVQLNKFKSEFDKDHPGYENVHANIFAMMARNPQGYVKKGEAIPASLIAAKDLLEGVKIAEKFPELGFKSYQEALKFDAQIKEMAEALPAVQKLLVNSTLNSKTTTEAKELLETFKNSGITRWDIIKQSERDWAYKVNEAHVKNGGENLIGGLLNANGYSATIAAPQSDSPILNKIGKSLTLENIAQRMDSLASKFTTESVNTNVKTIQPKM